MSDMMTTKNMTGFLFGLCSVAVLAVPVQAQDTDGRWTPFIGCWEAVGAEEEIGLLCFSPENGGVALQNLVGGELVSTEQLVADGARRPVTAEGCEGWETVEFSEDGRRAFTTTEFLCDTEEPRSGSGVMTFVAPNRWADVRALEVDGEPFAWVQEYQLASIDRLAEEGVDDPASGLDMAVRAGRMAAAAPITLEDVIEGSARMDEKAVETWIVVQGDRFDASARDLLALSEAGASDAVIDAVVAVSNPERFMVEAGQVEQYEDDYVGPTHYRGYMGFNPFWGSSLGVGYGAYGYSPYGYRSYGYNPYYYGGGYGYAGGYGYGYYGGRRGIVIIDRRRAGGGTVYKDRGYTQGSAGGSGTAQRRGGAQPQYSGGASSSAGSRGSSGSRGSTPRRAVRRRPPGGSSSISSAPAVNRRSPTPSASRPQARPQSRPSARTQSRPQARTQSRPSARTQARPQARTQSRPSARPQSRPSTSRRPVRPSGSSRPSAASRPSRPAPSARPSGASRSTRPAGASARPARRPNGR